MRTREALSAVRDRIGTDVAVVAGTGRSTWGALEVWGDNVLYLDALGAPAPVGVGLAYALAGTTCTAVVSVEGDGSFLFEMASLATLAAVRGNGAPHLAVVLDNSIYESGGGMPTRTFDLTWSSLVRAFGLPYAEASDTAGVAAAVDAARNGVLRLVVDDDDLPRPTYTATGAERVTHFRRLLHDRFGVPMRVPADKY